MAIKPLVPSAISNPSKVFAISRCVDAPILSNNKTSSTRCEFRGVWSVVDPTDLSTTKQVQSSTWQQGVRSR